MSMFERTRALYADLAKALGVEALPPDGNGGIQLAVGEDDTVILFAQDDVDVLAVVPVMALPPQLDHGTMCWLLRRNFYDSDLDPFRLAADASGNVILWGRVPIEGTTGERLAGLLDALAEESGRIRGELDREA